MPIQFSIRNFSFNSDSIQNQNSDVFDSPIGFFVKNSFISSEVYETNDIEVHSLPIYGVNQFYISNKISDLNDFQDDESITFSTTQFYTSPFLLQEDSNFDSYNLSTGFYARQFLLNIGLVEENNIETYDAAKIYPVDVFSLVDSNKETNLVNIRDSSVIISGANYRNLIRTGITGAN